MNYRHGNRITVPADEEWGYPESTRVDWYRTEADRDHYAAQLRRLGDIVVPVSR
jgi:hypothetical protein